MGGESERGGGKERGKEMETSTLSGLSKEEGGALEKEAPDRSGEGTFHASFLLASLKNTRL